MKRLISMILSLLLSFSLLCGCQQTDSNSQTKEVSLSSNEDSGNSAEVVKVDFSQADGDMFTSRDSESGYDKDSVKRRLCCRKL